MSQIDWKPLKCLSVAQPWAWTIFNGKDFENRKWHSRAFKGPLLIHASKSLDYVDDVDWIRMKAEIECPDFSELTRGAIIGIVQHIGCWSINHLGSCPVERTVFAEGPYCHTLQNQTAFNCPIDYRGMPGLFDVQLSTVAGQLSQMETGRREFFRQLYSRWCEEQ